jgi:hypothetical protein
VKSPLEKPRAENGRPFVPREGPSVKSVVR